LLSHVLQVGVEVIVFWCQDARGDTSLLCPYRQSGGGLSAWRIVVLSDKEMA